MLGVAFLTLPGLLPGSTSLRSSVRPAAAALSLSTAAPPPDARRLLLDTGSAYRSKAAKEEALAAVRALPAEARDALIDEALALADAAASPSVGRRLTPSFARRWPFRVPSRRAALSGFGRLMARMEEVEPGTGQRFKEGDAPRRRRFLLTLLRQSAEGGGVRRVEGEARRREAASVPSMAEMLSRTPEIETPTYTVLASYEEQGWEVRRYDRFSVVSTNPNRKVEADGAAISSPSMRGAGGFQALAGYLFGGNQEGERLAMTTPVISASNAAGERAKMSFVMPSSYWNQTYKTLLAEAPTPKAGAGVSLEAIDGGGLGAGGADAVAVAWFGGFAGEEDVAARRAELVARVAADEGWEAADAGEPPLLLQYNDPFTPPWKRRNELALPVRATAAAV